MNFSNSGKFMGSYEVKHQEHQKAHLQTKDDGTKLLPHVSSFNKTRVCLELVWIRPRSPAALGNAIPGRPLWRALRIRPHSPAALENAVPGRPLWRALRKVPLLGTRTADRQREPNDWQGLDQVASPVPGRHSYLTAATKTTYLGI